MLKTESPRRSSSRIVLAFAAWDFWRTIRMFEATFFTIGLPAALYLMFTAILPIVIVYAVGALTGARLDDGWRWFAAAGLSLLGALPFAIYGLAAALLFRSEAAVSVSSGLLVVLAFFGNVFMPLSGTLLEIARFTPFYGTAALGRWPILEGYRIDMTSGVVEADPLWAVVLNVVGWTAIFTVIAVIAARSRTSR